MTKTKFDVEKSLQAVLYISERLQRRDFHKIFKVLYFADREHFAKYGRSITGDTYIKMLNGPVPSNIYDIFKAVKGDSVFSKNAFVYAKMFNVENGYYIKPLKTADLDYLSETDIEELSDSILQYGNLTFEKVKELSHGFAWKSAPDDCPISFEDILREAGQKEDYISYLNDFVSAQESFC